MLTLNEAKDVLRIDSSNTANDNHIENLLFAMPSYIENQTGMTAAEQLTEPLVDVVAGFILTLWYFADHADDIKLQRTIDSLLKSITLNANSLHRSEGAGD